MVQSIRCPKCGREVAESPPGRVHCQACGGRFTYGTRWGLMLITVAAICALVGVGTYLVLTAGLGIDSRPFLRSVVIGMTTGLVGSILARRFRRLSPE